MRLQLWKQIRILILPSNIQSHTWHWLAYLGACWTSVALYAIGKIISTTQAAQRIEWDYMCKMCNLRVKVFLWNFNLYFQELIHLGTNILEWWAVKKVPFQCRLLAAISYPLCILDLNKSSCVGQSMVYESSFSGIKNRSLSGVKRSPEVTQMNWGWNPQEKVWSGMSSALLNSAVGP